MSRLNRKQLRKMLLKEFKMIGMTSPSIGMLGKSPYGCDACGQSPCACDDDGECDACGMSPCGCDEYPDLEYDHPEHGRRRVDDIGSLGGDEAFGVGFEAGSSGAFGHSQGTVSKEDCCRAVLCLIECCDCPETKALLQECCEDILSRC